MWSLDAPVLLHGSCQPCPSQKSPCSWPSLTLSWRQLCDVASAVITMLLHFFYSVLFAVSYFRVQIASYSSSIAPWSSKHVSYFNTRCPVFHCFVCTPPPPRNRRGIVWSRNDVLYVSDLRTGTQISFSILAQLLTEEPYPEDDFQEERATTRLIFNLPLFLNLARRVLCLAVLGSHSIY